MPSEIRFTPEYIKEHGWDEFTFSASMVGLLMKDPRGLSNQQKYDKAVASLAKAEADLAKCSATAIKTRENLSMKIIKIKEDLPALKAKASEPSLSHSTITALTNIYTQVMFGRWEDITSKYMEKGLACEEDAITLYSIVVGEYYEKNKVRMRNEWVEGEMDFEDADTVFDTKVNWSIFQFNRVAVKKLDPIYYAQLQVYMWLFRKKKARLVYALINTPDHIYALEEKKLKFNFIGTEEDLEAAVNELYHLHHYDDIANEDKIRVFEIPFDEEFIAKIKKRIEECRWFLNQLTKRPTVTIYQKDENEEDEQSDLAA